MVDLAAALCADALAAGAARTHEPLLGAGAVAYRAKVAEWQAVVRRLEARYAAAVGRREPVAPASAWANWDPAPSTGGDFLWHRRAAR